MMMDEDKKAIRKLIKAQGIAFGLTHQLLPIMANTAIGKTDGSGKLAAMVLAITVNNLINTFMKSEKHFPEAFASVLLDDATRKRRTADRENSPEEQMDKAIERETAKPATDQDTLVALKELFGAIDKVMASPGVKGKVSEATVDKAADLRKLYDNIVNAANGKPHDTKVDEKGFPLD